jgi:hypothetical protein
MHSEMRFLICDAWNCRKTLCALKSLISIIAELLALEQSSFLRFVFESKATVKLMCSVSIGFETNNNFCSEIENSSFPYFCNTLQKTSHKLLMPFQLTKIISFLLHHIYPFSLIQRKIIS